tara:strand:+ start:521 stop:1081 length:561 start_codon:yes stop_codon:yes gene_type:complete
MLDTQVSNIIKKRRSIYPKQFTGKQIPKKFIIELLKNANTAPTHKMTQPWFFKIYSKKSKIKLAKELIKIQKIKTIEIKEKLYTKFALTSHIICICMRRSEVTKIPEWEEVAATAMAVQNIWISCVNSQNIGGYWSTPGAHNKLNKFLKLKNNERCLGLFYLGIHDSTKNRKKPRKNIQTDICWCN